MSKELEALKKIKDIKTISVPERRVVTFQEKYKEELDLIETSLKKQEQDQVKLKALEVILKRDFIDLKLLRKCRNHYEYNRQVAIRYESRGMDIALLQEDDFDILKKAMV